MLNPPPASPQQVADSLHTQTTRLNNITGTLCRNSGVLICDDEREPGQQHCGMPAGADKTAL